jgi:acetyl/propionyl-CoA carboxylase alpha subunit
LTHPQHIEVQILADKFANCLHIGERDCSIQRRHQKMLEESPSSLSQSKREEVFAMAIALAKSVNYQSLGTVEFLYQDEHFYFMEMNTRIQVEHPVTEMVSGLDLVKEQIRVARGEELRFKQSDIVFRGHALECRINAEHAKTFAPSPGTITGYHEPGGFGVRVDSMVYSGYTVPSLYDSMITKVITHGENRQECIARMRRALGEFKVEGIHCNVAFHRGVMQDKVFNHGDIDTTFLDGYWQRQQ